MTGLLGQEIFIPFEVMEYSEFLLESMIVAEIESAAESSSSFGGKGYFDPSFNNSSSMCEAATDAIEEPKDAEPVQND